LLYASLSERCLFIKRYLQFILIFFASVNSDLLIKTKKIMTSIQFHLRPSSRGREFEGSLFIRVIHRRKALSITTSFLLFPSEWNEPHRKIIYRPEGVSRFLYLSGVEKMMVVEKELISSIISSLEEQGEFSVTDIVRLYRLRKSGVPMLPFVEKLADRLINHGQYRTARAYRTTSRGLAHFAGKSSSFTLTDIRPSLLKEFQENMVGKGKTMNTVSFYMRNLRAIYNRAIRESLVEFPKRNPFEGVYTGVEQTKKRALSKEDMTLLSRDLLSVGNKDEERPKNIEALSVAQRLFLFSFHARGMSFVDVAFLKKSDIHNNILIYRRRKTGQQLKITVSVEMRRIINSFSDHTKYSPYIFPIIRKPGQNEYRQYETALKLQNRRLKQLAACVGLSSSGFREASSNCQLSNNVRLAKRKATINCQLVKLSTHVARHTWASLAKELNFPLAVISEALGHTSEKTTSIYLSSFDRTVLDSMNRRISRAVKKVG